MILYSKQRLTIAELHFDEQTAPPTVDIIRYRSRSEKIEGTVSYPQSTILIDLTQEEDALLAQLSKTTRNEVRRAAKDELTFEFSAQPDNAWLADFFEFYAEFATQKGLDGLNRERIVGMRDSQALILTRVKGVDGSVLVWHCYVYATAPPAWCIRPRCSALSTKLNKLSIHAPTVICTGSTWCAFGN